MKKIVFLLVLGLQIVKGQTTSEKAKKNFDKGNFDEAIKLYTKLIKENNGSATDYYYRGLSFIELKKVQEGFDDLSSSIKLMPDYSEAYHQRGTLLLNYGKTEDGIDDLSMAIKYAKNDSIKIWSYVNRASGKLSTMNVESAIKDCKEALKLDSLNKGAIINLSNCYGIQKRFDLSVPLLKKAYALDSMDVFAISNLGYELSQTGKYSESLYYFERALKIRPNDAFVLSNKSYSYMKLGKTKEALNMINRSIEFNSANSYAYKNLGLIYLEMKETVKACEAFNTAIKKGFRDMYGQDVDDLVKEHCSK